MEEQHDTADLQRIADECALPHAPLPMPVQQLKLPGQRRVLMLLATFVWPGGGTRQAS